MPRTKTSKPDMDYFWRGLANAYDLIARPPTSLDAPLSPDDREGGTLLDTLTDDRYDPLKLAIRSEQAQNLIDAMNRLSERESFVVYERVVNETGRDTVALALAQQEGLEKPISGQAVDRIRNIALYKMFRMLSGTEEGEFPVKLSPQLFRSIESKFKRMKTGSAVKEPA